MSRRKKIGTRRAFGRKHTPEQLPPSVYEEERKAALLSHNSALTHYAITVQWRFVWFRIIAKYWSDEEFKAKIDASMYATDEGKAIRELILEEFDLDIGDQVVLRFYEASWVAFPDPDTDGELGDDPWQGMPPMEVKMPIPPRPEKEELHAIALAAFTGSGRSYPFTCA